MVNLVRTPRDIVRREYSAPRTAVYRLVYGDAKTGLGHADPARDGRKNPRYETPGQFYGACKEFLSNLPLCGFDGEKSDVVVRALNRLRPPGALPMVLDPRADLASEPETIPANKPRAPRKPKAAPADAHVSLPVEPAKKRAPRKPITPIVEAL